jgi:LemA protein
MFMQISSAADIATAAQSSVILPRKGGGRGHAKFGAMLRGLLLSLFVALPLAGCGVNNIPSYSEQAKATWAQVLNQYQRRTDLVPNLVATVKGAADFESKTLQAVVEARAKVGQMQLPPDILTNPDAMKTFEQNQGQLTSALSRLMVVVEQYPQLKANANFQTLQAQLEGTENRIAVARRDYIQAVQQYNTELKTFPGRIWAMLLYSSYKEMAQFTVDEKTMTVPTVNFN